MPIFDTEANASAAFPMVKDVSRRTEFLGVVVAIFCGGCLTPRVRYVRPGEGTGSGRVERHIAEQPAARNAPDPADTPADQPQSVEEALRSIIDPYIGIPYRHGGTSKRGMDCSGFVLAVLHELGFPGIPRTSRLQRTVGSPVPPSRIRPGDLVFFRTGVRGTVNHVGIYVGGRSFAHASRSVGVTYSNLDSRYFRNRLVAVRRLP